MRLGDSMEADLGAAAEEATASLRRTRALMAAELGRGAATLGVMGASTATLQRAHSEFSSQRGTLASGRRLLHALTRAATADRVVLWAGSLLFCLVVVHIALKRVPFLTPLHPLYQLRRRRAAALAATKPHAAPAAGLWTPSPPETLPVLPPLPPPPPMQSPPPSPPMQTEPVLEAATPGWEPAVAATVGADTDSSRWAAAPVVQERIAAEQQPAAERDLAPAEAAAPPSEPLHAQSTEL